MLPWPSAQKDKVGHDSPTGACDTGLALHRTIAGAVVQPIGQPVTWAELLEEPNDVIAALLTSCWAFDAQHVELANQIAYRSIKGHVSECAVPTAAGIGGIGGDDRDRFAFRGKGG
jgi:hypothetical protein